MRLSAARLGHEPWRAPAPQDRKQAALLGDRWAFLYRAGMNMVEVIARGAAQRMRDLPCPFCGADPPLAAKIAGRFVVGCENDDCAANPQVAAIDLMQAWDKWNRRAP